MSRYSQGRGRGGSGRGSLRNADPPVPRDLSAETSSLEVFRLVFGVVLALFLNVSLPPSLGAAPFFLVLGVLVAEFFYDQVNPDPVLHFRPPKWASREEILAVQPHGPPRALRWLVLVLPPVFFLIDLLVLAGIPLWSLAGLALTWGVEQTGDLGEASSPAAKRARRLLRGTGYLFVWLQVLAWLALSSSVPSWIAGRGWIAFRVSALPVLALYLWIPERRLLAWVAPWIERLGLAPDLPPKEAPALAADSATTSEAPPEVPAGGWGEARCPFCEARLAMLPVVRCRRCGTPHHHECWAENGLCTTYACGERDYDWT